MKTLEIIGYKRANLGKSDAKSLRAEGNVPCVIYGGEDQIHFYAPVIQFRDLIYTPNVYFINLNIEGQEIRCVLQDIQFHPVSEIILHVDFLQLFDGKPVSMDIPVSLVGKSPGVINGGVLVSKRRTLRIESLPKDMPSEIEVDISELDFHKSIKVESVEEKEFSILDPDQASIAVVEIPRALKMAEEEQLAAEELEAALEAEEGAEGEEGTEGTEGKQTEGKEGEAPKEGGDENPDKE